MVVRAVSTAAWLAAWLTAATPAEKVLIIADEWPQMAVLADFLRDRGAYAVEQVEQDQLPEDLSGYCAVIQFIHRRMSNVCAQRLMDYAQRGGRLLVLHHGISSKKRETEGWLPFLGIRLDTGEDALQPYRWIEGVRLVLVNLDPDHYITSHNVTYSATIEYRCSDRPGDAVARPALIFEDSEVYLNHQFTDAAEKTVLFGMRYEEAQTGEVVMQDRGGWYKRAGAGWVFYFQPGHSAADFKKESYCQVLLNCMTWKPE